MKIILFLLISPFSFNVLTSNYEVEFFFKAADALVLPYKFIFQSGLVFLAMTFNIPVIAKNVGGLSYDILENETGIVYENDNDLTSSIRYFYNSSIFTNFLFLA